MVLAICDNRASSRVKSAELDKNIFPPLSCLPDCRRDVDKMEALGAVSNAASVFPSTLATVIEIRLLDKRELPESLAVTVADGLKVDMAVVVPSTVGACVFG